MFNESAYNKSNIIEKHAALIIGLGLAVFLAFSVASGVKHSMDKVSHTLATVSQPQ